MIHGGTLRASDLLLAVFVVAIAAMLLVPLPATLLDFLLTINISFSFLLLLVGLYMPNALALLAFPTLLLLTTLFRLGLNVASTRLILSDQYAGEVIQAFGNFLTRGEVVVGIIIFTIITVVNFIVVARGASRVSEVAARFALDALPGKQMAIDADLRSGIITSEEAQRKRDDLRKESQLYGAMDGAMKFVQGDVIAGIFIIFVNIVGGMYLGIKTGMNFSEAIQTYTLLTIGDGLVSQVPALLISVCAGIVVTRVSSGENTTLGTDVGSQLFGRPGAIFFAGILIALFGLFPGLPHVQFIGVGAVFAAIAFYIQVAQRKEVESFGTTIEGLEVLPHSSVRPMLASRNYEAEPSPVVSLVLDSAFLYPMYRERRADMRDWWSHYCADLYDQTGLDISIPEIREGFDLPYGGYSLLLQGIAVRSGTVPMDASLVELHPGAASLFGLSVLKSARHPFYGSEIFWTSRSDYLSTLSAEQLLRVFSPLKAISLELYQVVRDFPEEFLKITDVHEKLRRMEKSAPGFLGDVLSERFLSVSRLTEVMHELVRQGLRVRDFQKVVEMVARYCSQFGISRQDEESIDIRDIVSFIRQHRSRFLISRVSRGQGMLRVLTLSEEIESKFNQVQIQSDQLPIEFSGESGVQIRQDLEQYSQLVQRAGIPPVVVLCAAEVQPQVSLFVRSCNLPVEVVTTEEIRGAVHVEPFAVWGG